MAMQGKGTNPIASRVQRGRGQRCQAPARSSDRTAPMSKPIHNPRNALAQRRRRAAPESAVLINCNSLMASVQRASRARL